MDKKKGCGCSRHDPKIDRRRSRIYEVLGFCYQFPVRHCAVWFRQACLGIGRDGTYGMLLCEFRPRVMLTIWKSVEHKHTQEKILCDVRKSSPTLSRLRALTLRRICRRYRKGCLELIFTTNSTQRIEWQISYLVYIPLS